jgi:thioredoxin reductase (NADPH)
LQETPDLQGAYPRLDADEIDRLAEYGTRRPTRSDETLVREGDHDYDFYVVTAGTVAVLESGEVIRVHGKGRFIGELGQLTGQPAFFTAIAQEPGEVVQVPIALLRELIAAEPWFGDMVLRAYLVRRSLLIELGAGLRIVGSRFSTDTRRLRDFAARNRLPYRWIDLEEDREAESLLCQLGIPPHDTPVVILFGDQVLRNPSNAELARVTGLPVPEQATTEEVCDLLVVGAGPAGLAAAVYGASEGLDTVLFDAIATGGQAGASSRIENYLGFPGGISGGELAERAVIQCRKFGARLGVPVETTALESKDGSYAVRRADGGCASARSVVIATGARYRRLAVPGLDRFEGQGVYYAATEVEALACRKRPVAIVGGGNSAGQAAMYLAECCRTRRVHLLVRSTLGPSMSEYLVGRIRGTSNITVHEGVEIDKVSGGRRVEAIELKRSARAAAGDGRNAPPERLRCGAIFVFIGADPQVPWLPDTVARDHLGYILTGADALATGRWPLSHREPCPLETTLPGVLAAGDVRAGSTKRVGFAVGDGSLSVTCVHKLTAIRSGRTT